MAAMLTGLDTLPANRPLSVGAAPRNGTTLNPSLSRTKSSLTPACNPKAVRNASGIVTCPLLVIVAVGMYISLPGITFLLQQNNIVLLLPHGRFALQGNRLADEFAQTGQMLAFLVQE